MSYTSYITAKPIMGYDPVGYLPFAVPVEKYFVTTHTLVREYNELTFFPIVGGISTVQADFLAALKLDIDFNYFQVSFSDVARAYFADYNVVRVERTFNSSSTSIWNERTYVWKVTIQVRVNTAP